jgi:hypothetical protein
MTEPARTGSGHQSQLDAARRFGFEGTYVPSSTRGVIGHGSVTHIPDARHVQHPDPQTFKARLILDAHAGQLMKAQMLHG